MTQPTSRPPDSTTLLAAFDHLVTEVGQVADLIETVQPDHTAFDAATELARLLRETGTRLRCDVARRIRDTQRLSLAQLADVIGVSKARAQQMVGNTPRKDGPVSPSPLPIKVEVWPVLADSVGLWLAESDAWRSGPVLADSEPHAAVLEVVAEHVAHPLDDDRVGRIVNLLHSTSWRPSGDAVTLTYVAVLDLDGEALAVDTWPHALPVDVQALLGAVGKPAPHGPTDPPVPRHLDVLLHAIRHLAYLIGYDSSAREALGEDWHRQLADVQPSLAGLYESE